MAAPKLTEKERHFRSLIAERETSGLSLARFARSRGIPEGTFSWWCAEVRRRDELRRAEKSDEASRAGAISFVPVRIVADDAPPTTAPRASSRFEVILPGGARVRVPESADEESVARVLRAVVATC
jgi:hypothetical protein